jgi:antirestriction protein ArdC
MSVYQIITDNIIGMLEQGVVPWRKPWRSAGGNIWPRSARNIKYRGINVFILHTTKMARGYTSNFWVTYKQAQAMGGTVKKGEKGTTITFWKVGQPIREFDEDTQRTVTRRPFMLRYYTVFNIDQCENLTLTGPMKAEAEAIDSGLVDNPTLDDAEAIVATYFARDDAPTLRENAQDECYYVPALDEIVTPLRGQYDTPEGYYYSLFHEMGHSTGHAKRLNRKGIGEFSHGSYGKEELVAEMTAAFLNAEAGIDGIVDQNAAYINSWLTQLRADNTLVVQAASNAQKALDYIMGIEYNNESEVE